MRGGQEELSRVQVWVHLDGESRDVDPVPDAGGWGSPNAVVQYFARPVPDQAPLLMAGAVVVLEIGVIGARCLRYDVLPKLIPREMRVSRFIGDQ